MTIQEFWEQARPAQRAEALQIAGVPKEWVNILSYLEWAELKPLSVAMLERVWDNSRAPLPEQVQA